MPCARRPHLNRSAARVLLDDEPLYVARTLLSRGSISRKKTLLVIIQNAIDALAYRVASHGLRAVRFQ